MFDWNYLAQQLINGLTLGSIYGLIAIGYSLVYGIIGMINFAHGDVYMISAYLTAIALAICSLFGIHSVIASLFITMFFAMSITGLYGWAIERIAYRPLRHSTRLAPLISAIGMSIVLEEFVRISQGARNQAVPMLIKGQWHIDSLTLISTIQMMIIAATIISVFFLSIIINKTSIGRAMRATQQDLLMAEILGISANKIIPLVFVIGSVMAAIAGCLVSLNYGSFNYAIGFIIGIKAFTSAVLGGIGSLPGAMLGGLLLGMAESLYTGFFESDYKDVFAFSLLILVLILKPSGLLGTADVEKV
ncbi:MAG: branched-chain amino acid ABC transporter permease LivH [Gammaproteobacteria bacterium 39-13]|nr:branched-chain amino acid ABC transporter permease LivH [Gammaproteobacteria bacterium]OJV87905.1 MAG: branched-chain amino acid ABC transporter permease LivH [Gammaproteobacteria bacterium 39-13]